MSTKVVFFSLLCRVCRGVCKVGCTPQSQQRRGFAASVQGVQGPTCGRARVSVMRNAASCKGANSRARSKYPAHPAHHKKMTMNQGLKACRVVETPMHAGLHTLHTGFSEGDMAERTIKCTPDNAAQFQQVVRHWPELHDLVKQLQAQDLFPGLRAMQITLMGDESHCARGLGALLPEDAQEGQK